MKFIYIILFFLLNFTLIKTDELEQVGIVAQIIKNSATPQMEEVWPQYDLHTKPVVITYGNKHIYAFNLKSADPHWEKVQINGVDLLYSSTDRWGLTSAPMQFDFDIEGQKAFVFRIDVMNDMPFIPYFVLMHERFHVYQIQKFESEKDVEEMEYPESQNVDNLALMQMEELILLDFLQALSEDSQEDLQLYLKTYISVNKKRRKLLCHSSQKWEDRQQMIEGLADYVAAKNLDVFFYFGSKEAYKNNLNDLSEQEAADGVVCNEVVVNTTAEEQNASDAPRSRSNRLSYSCTLPKVGQKHLIKTMHQYTQDDNITERAIKWRHYGVGSSIAYALDYLQVKDWKQQVERNVSLQKLLEDGISQQQEAQLFHQAVKKYDFDLIKIRVNKTITAYNKMLESQMKSFNNHPGITIVLQSPKRAGISSGGRSKGILSLADGSMLSMDDTSKASSADNAWNLELKSIPQLFQHKGFRRFKDEKETIMISIDGEDQPLRHLTEREFHHLSLKGKSCLFKSSYYKGRIKLIDNILSITYE
jgi:hypothetical protein